MTVWFITGAARGLGLEIARAALAGGEKVIAAARRPESILGDVREHPNASDVRLDVTDPGEVGRAGPSSVEKLLAGAKPQLPQDVRGVGLHRREADEQLASNLRVRVTLQHKPQHLLLA